MVVLQVTVAILLDKFVNASLQVQTTVPPSCSANHMNSLPVVAIYVQTCSVSLITTDAQTEIEERSKRREAKDSHNVLTSTMDPLLARLAQVLSRLPDVISGSILLNETARRIGE